MSSKDNCAYWARWCFEVFRTLITVQHDLCTSCNVLCDYSTGANCKMYDKVFNMRLALSVTDTLMSSAANDIIEDLYLRSIMPI